MLIRKLRISEYFSEKRYLFILIFVICVLIFSCVGCSNSYKPIELKGYYQQLVQYQFNLNNEDTKNKRQYARAVAEGNKLSIKYYFQLGIKNYYVLDDKVFLQDGSKITDLQTNSEGYFVYKAKFYYVYGEEQEKTDSTLGGPVSYTLKDYQYSQLDLNPLNEKTITKEEYEKLYYNISNQYK